MVSVISKKAFGRFHPAVNFIFFALAIAFCVVLRHPAFQMVSLLAAFAACLCLGVRLGGRSLAYLSMLFLLVSLVNPIFNDMGETVMFSYFGGRAFTLESLAFGVSSAAMLIGMLLWFLAFGAVLTTDKLSYLFGSVAPALSLVLVMVLRLLPSYRDKLADFASARAGLRSKDEVEAGALMGVKEALMHVSMLMTWAFEGAVQTADSMRSRAYGMGKRSHYALFRFEARDGVLLAIVLCMAAGLLLFMLQGLASTQYFPVISFAPLDFAACVSLALYAALLFVPLLVNLGEGLAWRMSLSRI